MIKFRLYFDKDKEEKWLNEMSEQGWAMAEFFAGVYVFVRCEPGKYIYRVDMPGEFGKMPIWEQMRKYREYIDLVEETGAEFVCRWGWWLIFRREAAQGEFVLYTDTESQIGLYRRIRKLFLFVGVLELSLALNNTGNALSFWGRNGFGFRGMDMFLFFCMVVCYSFVAGVLLISLRLTRKIRSLRD